MTRTEALIIALLHQLLVGVAITTGGTVEESAVDRFKRMAEGINEGEDLLQEAIKVLRRDPL